VWITSEDNDWAATNSRQQGGKGSDSRGESIASRQGPEATVLRGPISRLVGRMRVYGDCRPQANLSLAFEMPFRAEAIYSRRRAKAGIPHWPRSDTVADVRAILPDSSTRLGVRARASRRRNRHRPPNMADAMRDAAGVTARASH